MLHRFKESVLQTIGQKKSSYTNKEYQLKVEKYNQFIRSVEQVHDSIILFIEANDLAMSASLGVAESLCTFSMDVRNAGQAEGVPGPMNLVTLHFLKIQEDLALLYREHVKRLLQEHCLRPLESILAMSALVAEKEKIIRSSTLDCDHFKSRKESEIQSGKRPDHPTVLRLNEQLTDAERVVAMETCSVMNFFARVDAHMATMLGPETSVLVGALQFSHSSSSHLLAKLNTTLPQSAATICELAARFEEEKATLKSRHFPQPGAQEVVFPSISSHVQFLNVDVFSPLQGGREVESFGEGDAMPNMPQADSMPILTLADIQLTPPDKCGMLKKKNKLFWEDRWFELRKPGILTWYKNSPESSLGTSATRRMSLSITRRTSTTGSGGAGGGVREEARNHLNLEEVTCMEYLPNTSTISLDVERKTYVLLAASEDLAAEWHAALLPWIKKDTPTTSVRSSAASASSDAGGASANVSTSASTSASASLSDESQTIDATHLPTPSPTPPVQPRPLSMKPKPTDPPPPPSSLPSAPPHRPVKPKKGEDVSEDTAP